MILEKSTLVDLVSDWGGARVSMVAFEQSLCVLYCRGIFREHYMPEGVLPGPGEVW